MASLLSLSKTHAPATPVDHPQTVEEIMARLPLKLQADLHKLPVQLRIDAYITNDPGTQELLRAARLCAYRAEPVLIQGESGTGKEILAQIMLANRPKSQFFAANCAGLVDTLFESLLFGHTRGSFTGSVADKPGLLVSAQDGIVFLDEIGELPLNQQAKILRTHQQRTVMPVGSDREVPIKCRFVFATNRDLVKEVEELRFREDLYYRISALTLHTTPLRQRPDDVILIAHHICAARNYTPPDYVPEHIVQSSGNVRALENWLLQREVFGVGRDDVNPALGENA